MNMVCTNVPGPQIPLYSHGRELMAWYPFLPVPPEMALSFGILSYNQRLYITAIADREAVPDMAFMMRCLNDTYAALRKQADVDPLDPVPIKRKKRTRKK
jgi:hypothetical protein